ncbi:MAG: tripartite tricarboxylate transporter TctB family protein [Comamonadaceae bacterium]|nr:MAG: tripartite tricarboxylate transporter TctB family protein [Comamonadaceae bacterium]
MTDPALARDPAPADTHDDDEARPPRADLRDGIGWIVLGLAAVIGSWTMDRLEQQNINPVTVPGLLPGLLGAAMVLLGGVLTLRSWRRGALTTPLPATTADDRDRMRRVWVAIALCLGYGVVLVGHGIPFWFASSLYVTVSILVFQRLSRNADERRLDARVLAKAVTIGVLASVITWLVFERVFLVRLP